MFFYLDDRMLLLFWLPILLCEYLGQVFWCNLLTPKNQLVSMLWAFHNGVRFAFQTMKLALPVKIPFRS